MQRNKLQRVKRTTTQHKTPKRKVHKRQVRHNTTSEVKKPSPTPTATLRGTKDYFPDSTFLYRHIESNFQTVLGRYGFNNEIRTPIIEQRDVFGKTLGDDSDVVMKQMYSFDDFGTPVVLRPENTASTVRALMKRGLIEPTTTTKPDGTTVTTVKANNDAVPPSLQHVTYPDQLYYCGPMFRKEKPQSGRLRQFTQFGVEKIGSTHLQDDVQAIAMARDCLKSIGMDKYTTLAINTIGTREERIAYEKALGEYLAPYVGMLSADSQKRFAQGHILRILDSGDDLDLYVVRGTSYNNNVVQTILQKRIAEGLITGGELPTPTGAPLLRNYLSDESLSRFNAILLHLQLLDVPYHVDDFLIRGLDYYCHTTFEFLANSANTDPIVQQPPSTTTTNKYTHLTRDSPLQTLPQGQYQAVLAGGRYEGIATRFDKFKSGLAPLNIGIGWASGIERIILHMDRVGLIDDSMVKRANDVVDIVITSMGSKRTLANNQFETFCDVYNTNNNSNNNSDTKIDNTTETTAMQSITDDGYKIPTQFVNAMNEQMKVWSEIKQYKTLQNAVKQKQQTAQNDDEKNNLQNELQSIPTPPVLPYDNTQVEAMSSVVAMSIAQHLRQSSKNYRVLLQPHMNYQKQLGAGVQHGAKYAIILGEEEISKNSVVVKNLMTREQALIPTNQLTGFFDARL